MKAVKKMTAYLISVVSLTAIALMIQTSGVNAQSAEDSKRAGNLMQYGFTAQANSMHGSLKNVTGQITNFEEDPSELGRWIITVSKGDGTTVKLYVCSSNCKPSLLQSGGGYGCNTCAKCFEVCSRKIVEAMTAGSNVRFFALGDDNAGYYILGQQDDPNNLETCYCFIVIS